MSQDKFDQELSQLYQQRKAQVKAPEVILDEKPNRPRKWSNRFTILSIAGASSFAVMALIASLVPKHATMVEVKQPLNVEVTIADTELKEVPDGEIKLPSRESLPKFEKPAHPEKVTVEKWQREKPVILAEKHDLSLENKQSIVTVPEPQIAPSYKVMPDTRKFAGEMGEITLSYQISATGEVINIKTVESNLSRNGQRVVKRAFKQWRFDHSASSDQRHTIKFNFTAPENNGS